MNGGLIALLSEAQTAEVLRQAGARRQTRRVPRRRHGDIDAIVRMAAASDGPALERLSQLEGRRLTPGPVLVAEQHDEVLAAVSIAGGAPIADPFRPTAGLVELLGRSLAHLHEDGGRRRWSPWGLLRRSRRHGRSSSAPAVRATRYS